MHKIRPSKHKRDDENPEYESKRPTRYNAPAILAERQAILTMDTVIKEEVVLPTSVIMDDSEDIDLLSRMSSVALLEGDGVSNAVLALLDLPIIELPKQPTPQTRPVLNLLKSHHQHGVFCTITEDDTYELSGDSSSGDED